MRMKKLLTYSVSLLFGALLSALLFLWMASGEIYDYQDNFNEAEHGAQIDVVLCLAGGKGRIPFAVNTWQRLRPMNKNMHTPVLYLAGLGINANVATLSEQGVSNELLKEIKKEDVVFENVSTNTFENAQIFSSFVRQKQWKNVLLITTGYHMKRSGNMLRKALGDEVNVYYKTMDSERFDRNQWHKDSYAIRVTMMEYIKWLFYRYSY
jgi:uncharacterized SAM-binding protein YcdF (DUF218 family)